MKSTVREANPEDAGAVRDVARESWHAAYDDLIGAESVDRTIDRWYAVDSLAESIAGAAERDDATFLVSERTVSTNGDRVVGFANAGPHPELEATAKLSRIYARPSVWGEGVGRRLLDRLEADLTEHFDRLWLEVVAGNEVGISFYESTGFDRIGEQESVLGDDVVEYLYEKALE
ncbi:GNAT family N-acetyltransferase [Halovivax gelatinilyticus]|uniref:GNAT family N-acetyltransferase n=1 Tax=Halovivax gelatinilyticus TaxID=2961597 RepID=UPI0020CA554A|nr:GNAT family N-acetyltransferase [Halovivax gelatinilyticus]